MFTHNLVVRKPTIFIWSGRKLGRKQQRSGIDQFESLMTNFCIAARNTTTIGARGSPLVIFISISTFAFSKLKELKPDYIFIHIINLL